MIDINTSLIIQAILDIGLMIILNKILFRPVLTFLDARRNKIETDEAEAKRLQEEAEQKRLQFDEGLNRGRSLAQEEKGRVRDTGTEEAKAMLAAIQKEIDQETPEIKAQIEGERQRVRAELHQRQGEIAKQIAEKLLGRNLQ